MVRRPRYREDTARCEHCAQCFALGLVIAAAVVILAAGFLYGGEWIDFWRWKP
jgi:hypothetical protein